jgi:hypothetical protein
MQPGERYLIRIQHRPCMKTPKPHMQHIYSTTRCGFSQAQTIAKTQSPWNSELLSIMNRSGASVSILHADGTGKENLDRRNLTISGSTEATSSASVMVIAIQWHAACISHERSQLAYPVSLIMRNARRQPFFLNPAS